MAGLIALAIAVGVGALLVTLGMDPGSVAGTAALLGFGVLGTGTALTPRAIRDEPGGLAVATTVGTIALALLWQTSITLGIADRVPRAIGFGLAGMGALRLARSSHRFDAALAVSVGIPVLLVGWTQLAEATLDSSGPLVLRTSYATEGLFHVALAQELRHAFPIGLVTGLEFAYHTITNALAALVVETTGASAFDATYRVLPLLLAANLGGTLYALGRRLGAGPGGAIAAALFPFATDSLAWVPAALGIGREPYFGGEIWCVQLLPPLTYALHHNRAFLLGAATAVATLLVAARFIREGSRGGLGTIFVLGAGLVQTKIFFAPIILGALLGDAALRARSAPGDARRAALVGGVLALSFLPAALSTIASYRAPVGGLEVFPGFPGLLALEALGLAHDVRAPGPWIESLGVPTALALGVLGVGLFTPLSLGVRALAVPRLVRAGSATDPLPRLLAIAIALGWLASHAVTLPPARENTLYFWLVSLVFLAPVAGLGLFEWLDRASPRRRVLGVALVALFGLPPVLQFLVVEAPVRNAPTVRVPAGLVAAGRHLERHANPGDVVVEPDPSWSYLAGAARVRVVIAWPFWLRNALPGAEVDRRVADVLTLFESEDREATTAVLDRYRVRWIWVPAGREAPRVRLGLTVAVETPDGRLLEVER